MSLDRVRDWIHNSHYAPVSLREELATHEKEDAEREARADEFANIIQDKLVAQATQLQELLEAAKSVLAVEFISKLHGHPYSTLRQVIQNIEGGKDARP